MIPEFVHSAQEMRLPENRDALAILIRTQRLSGTMPKALTQQFGMLLFLILLSLAPASARQAKTDRETGQIRVIYLGDCIVQENPSLSFIPEPWIDVARIPASIHWQFAHELQLGESIHKFMRRYMPRTYADLVTEYDVIILSDANVQVFRVDQLDWFKRGVEVDAMGLTMIGGDETFGGTASHPSWGPTSVGEILPVECVDGAHPKGSTYWVRVEMPDHPLLSSLPLAESPFPPFIGLSVTVKRIGASQLAELWRVGMLEEKSWPFLVEWERENGMVFAFTSDWTTSSGEFFLKWDYYDDFCINLMLHLSGVEIPQERELLHQVRARSREYQMRKTFLYAMMDFIEKFGARTTELEKIILEADEDKATADEHYMRVELSEALTSIQAALEKIVDADVTATKLKDSALFQVYLIEWLAVTGASLLAGSALYSLMVKRRAYKEMKTTRFVGEL